ncbi:WW domain-containing oxidoreductase [Cytospora mali]|uniref:WW domain-containing oxidoreductase n=1 Tax=Cytospora mali TaxID=578113 RepID=A0A194W9S0_CYTMA|nr:WW domain-containing oxidoreductase [Valsa mali]
MAHAPFTLSSRYEEAHKVENTAGPGDARPTGMQILKDENRLDGSLAGKVVIVTGCSSGVGVPTVEAMVAAGCIVYGGVRASSLDKTREALSSVLNDPKTKDKVHILEIDLASLASINAFAEEIKKREKLVNILINNAGVMAIPNREVTADGFEMQLGTNHLGHFYLFQNLKDLLIAGAKASPDFASRVVSLSSIAHRFGTVSFDDINMEKEGSYHPGKAYARSKTAVLWMANQVERLYGSQGIHGYTAIPGGIATPLQKHVQEQMEAASKDNRVSKHMKSVEQGCATTVWAATARDLEGRGGVCCENCCIIGPVLPVIDGYPLLAPGYAEWAYSPEGEERLWKVSNALVGLEEGA